MVVVGLFGLNALTTGEFSYQGGDRKTFYGATHGLSVREHVGDVRQSWRVGRDRRACPSTSCCTATPRPSSPGTCSTSRWAGTAAFCRTFSLGWSPWPCSSRAGQSAGHWQSWVAAGLVVGAVALMCYMPYTYSGGGGPDRQPLLRQLLSAVLVPHAGDSQRLADRHRPRRRRALHRQDSAEPVLLVVQSGRARQGRPAARGCRSSGRSSTICPSAPMPRARAARSAAVPPSRRTSWTTMRTRRKGMGSGCRGESRADLLLRAPATQTADNRDVSLRIRALSIEVTNGGAANRVVVSAGWESRPAGPGARGGPRRSDHRRAPVFRTSRRGTRPASCTRCRSRRAPGSSRSCTTRATPTAAIWARSSASCRSTSTSTNVRRRFGPTQD